MSSSLMESTLDLDCQPGTAQLGYSKTSSAGVELADRTYM